MKVIMWTTGVLGNRNPKRLVDTLLYVLGLHLALWGQDEHRRRRHQPAQITVKSGDDGHKFLEYREDVNKTRSGGLYSRGQRQKVTTAFSHN